MGMAVSKRNQGSSALSPKLIADLQMAVKFHQDNDLKNAEKLYKKALVASRNNPDVAILCAIFYQQIGRHKYVITFLKKILSKEPLHLKAQLLIGKSYLAEKNYVAALNALSQAHSLDPNDAEVCFKKGFCHHKMGQLDFVLSLYEKAYAGIGALAGVDQTSLFNHLADVLMVKGKPQDAISYLEEALSKNLGDYSSLVRLVVALGEGDPSSLKHTLNAMVLQPEADEAMALFAFSCEKKNLPAATSPQMKGLIINCLNSRSVNHQSIAVPWVRNMFFSCDKNMKGYLFKVEGADDFSEMAETQEFRDLFFDPYFYLGLKNIRPINIEMEEFYRLLRQYFLLKIKDNKRLSAEELTLLGAMAEQCYLNEFVFFETEEEIDFIEKTKEKLEGLKFFSEQDHQDILIYATYAPLLNLSNHQLLKDVNASSYLDDVIEIQFREPLHEQKLKSKIKSFGSIKNEVSQNVRSQYEENPYPRWKVESVFKPYHSKMIDQKYHQDINVLIAGCGTGKHIVSTFNFYPNAKFTAIDISKASLSYAKRKLIEYGLDDKVDLLHCDILDAKNMDKQFDFIECCGVLHHMEKPLEGLKSITSLLKPGGKIKLAYYSTLARQSVFAARDYIQNQGFEPTPSGIRQCRKFMTEESFSEATAFPIYKWTDFHSLSECRDLMFHVQETCYNLHEIEASLQEAGLEFECMLVSSAVHQAYKDKFPEDTDARDLKNWAEFEEENPATFAAMYQFRAIKK